MDEAAAPPPPHVPPGGRKRSRRDQTLLHLAGLDKDCHLDLKLQDDEEECGWNQFPCLIFRE